MNELVSLGISNNTIEKLNVNLSKKAVDELNKHLKLVSNNIKYLTDMGINNIDMVYSNYYDLFLLDHSKFVSIFSKYEASDLVDKISSNIEIIEFL